MQLCDNSNESIRKKAHGLILLSMMLVLQMIVIAASACLLEFASIYKQLLRLQQTTLLYEHARKISSSLSLNLIEYARECLINLNANEQLQLKAQAWWLQIGCHPSDHRYEFVLESLGQDHCAFVGNFNDSMVADYYRLTLFLHSDKMPDHSILVQSVYTVASRSTMACHSIKRLVNLGWQSDRLLSK